MIFPDGGVLDFTLLFVVVVVVFYTLYCCFLKIEF